MTPLDPLGEELSQLKAVCDEFGMTLEQALREKTEELQVRLFLKCIPNERLKESQYFSFLSQVLGRPPSEELINRVKETYRGPRMKDEEIETLDSNQNGRCKLCGSLLSTEVNPEVDHIIPVAHRGKSEMSNYQLLCEVCNNGKSKLEGGIIGAPFLDCSQKISHRLRYFVLKKSLGRCQFEDCWHTSRDHKLDVVPIIPVAQGGRNIFDNLMAICIKHKDERAELNHKDARQKLRKVQKQKPKLLESIFKPKRVL